MIKIDEHMITLTLTLKWFIILILLFFLTIFLIKYFTYIKKLIEYDSFNIKELKKFKFKHFINRIELEILIEILKSRYLLKLTNKKYKRYKKIKSIL